MPMRRPFSQVDVFSTTPYAGNPVAVVLDGTDLSTEEMAQFARWTNLSETTFLLPPDDPQADYRLRIFTSSPLSGEVGTSAYELPFAGHPTLGSCHAWLSAGGVPRHGDTIVQECGVGLVSIRRTADGLAFAAPPLRRSGPVEETLVAHIAALLQIERTAIVAAAWADNGPGWVAVLLESAEAVLRLRPRPVDLALGVVGPYPPGAPHAIEVRAFIPQNGATIEDPVTGSLNAALAQWLLGTQRLTTPYVASQGTALDRAGRVHVSQDDDGTIWVGGGTVTCISGQVEL
jgi:PhzF family phenazine biosynthesis protein